MKLENKQNHSSLKALSEKEIQEKLYGHLKPLKTGDLSVKERSAIPVSQKPEENSSALNEQAGGVQVIQKEAVLKVSDQGGNPVSSFRKTILNEFHSGNVRGADFSKLLASNRKPSTGIMSSAFPTIRVNGFWKRGSFLLIAFITILAGAYYFAKHKGAGEYQNREFQNSEAGADSLIGSSGLTKQVAPPSDVESKFNESTEEAAGKIEVLTSHISPKAPVSPQKLESEAGVSVRATTSSVTDPTKPTDAHVPLGEQPEKENYFTIQICTYRLESDAKKLTKRLQSLDLPAHYQGVSAKNNQPPRFYIVLLSKEKNYQDAQLRLTQFKKLHAAKEFSDAFVRRISS